MLSFYIPNRELRPAGLSASSLQGVDEIWTDLLTGRGVPAVALQVTHTLGHGVIVRPLFVPESILPVHMR